MKITMKRLSDILMTAITVIVIIFGFFWPLGFYYLGGFLAFIGLVAIALYAISIAREYWEKYKEDEIAKVKAEADAIKKAEEEKKKAEAKKKAKEESVENASTIFNRKEEKNKFFKVPEDLDDDFVEAKCTEKTSKKLELNEEEQKEFDTLMKKYQKALTIEDEAEANKAANEAKSKLEEIVQKVKERKAKEEKAKKAAETKARKKAAEAEAEKLCKELLGE